jgi:hypothetical protein
VAESTQTPVQQYLEVIGAYEAEFKRWFARVEKILKRYRDDTRNQSGNDAAKFNILWSNVQTLVPAVYSHMPKADVSRRFVDNDPVGRVAALLIERCLDYEIEHYSDFRSAMTNCVNDRFLGGRGVSWVRYDPHIKTQDDGQITEDVPDPQDKTSTDEQEPQEEVDYECSPTDYVYWKDFGHSSARTWEEVTAVWRWVYMTKPALEARFGKATADKIPLDAGPQKFDRNMRGEKLQDDRARICELWDKEKGKAVWFSKHLPDPIDERDDPLDLEGFFPCPKPLYATTTTDTLVPVPDFVLYQDQANELDILSDRIDGLVKALRVRGIYDASQPALQRLLTEGDNNTLIGTDKWAAFSEKGGLKGSIDLIPIETFAAALLQCYQARADIKSQVYEITGISDIVRGQGAASETATAQQIKGQYAGLRLKSMQEGVAIFATELLRIKAQIICSKYQDKTILAYSAAQQMSQDDQALIPQALQLIRNDPMRCFRIEVAADSLVQIDEQQTKQERLEFLGATANFLREAVPAGQQVPELVPAMMALIKFGIAGFKQARTIEGTFDVALQKLEAKAAQMAANPQPNPEVQKAQAQAQADAQTAQMQAQADAQVEQFKAQANAQIEQMKMQHESQMQTQQLAHQQAMEQMKLDHEQAYAKWEAELKAATQIEVALISAGQNAGGPAEQATVAAQQDITKSLGDGFALIQEQSNKIAQAHASAMQQMHAALQLASAPKRIIRGPDGRAVGVEPINPTVQ